MTLCKVNSFAVGDIVSVIGDVEKVKELQKGHGEWIDIMKNVSDLISYKSINYMLIWI